MLLAAAAALSVGGGPGLTDGPEVSVHAQDEPEGEETLLLCVWGGGIYVYVGQGFWMLGLSPAVCQNTLWVRI